MKFGDFYIGMPVFLLNDPETVGVIIKYSGVDSNKAHWVVIDNGRYEEEFALRDLGKFNKEW